MNSSRGLREAASPGDSVNDLAKRPRGLDRASLYILGASLALATMGTLTHSVGPRCDWLVVALVRALVMLTTAATLAKSSGSALVVWRPRSLWVRSLAGSCSLVCNFFALTRLPVADAITLFSVQPLWIVLISALLLRRLPTPGEAIGVACGMLGVVLLERPHLSGDRLAALVALFSSFSSAVAMLGLHRLRHIDSRSVVAHFAGVAALVSVAWLILRGDSLPPGLLEPSTWLFLAGIGATGTLGQILLTKAYAAGAPAKIAVVGLAQVVFAMLYDVLLWGRSLDPIGLAGFVLVLAPTTWLGIRSARVSVETEVRVDVDPQADSKRRDSPEHPVDEIEALPFE
jgi:drug/metabolite transporter (DMT)-like permease